MTCYSIYYLPPNPTCPTVFTPCTTPSAQSSNLAYVGPALPYSGIVNCDTLSVVIQKIEQALVNLSIPVISYVAKSANYTLSALDTIVECTANSFTITLPSAVGITGKPYIINNSGTGNITVATTSSQTINGSLIQLLDEQYDSLHVVSNGTNWIII